MRYYNVNIKHFGDPANIRGKRISHAPQWLDDRQRVPIFFGRNKIDEILADAAGLAVRAQGEAREFCEIGRNRETWHDRTFVTVDKGQVWVYRPCGEIEEEEIDTYPEELPKSMPVEILARTSVRDVPLVLAGMRANQAFSLSTFREIEPTQYPGNVLAIACGCGRDDGDLLPEGIRPVDVIDCLSSVELETLVAKLFEHSNCFVPAYKGGFVPDIDLIVENDGANRLLLDGLGSASRASAVLAWVAMTRRS